MLVDGIAPKNKDIESLKAQCQALDKAIEKMVDGTISCSFSLFLSLHCKSSLIYNCIEYHSGFNNSINTFSGIVKKISGNSLGGAIFFFVVSMSNCFLFLPDSRSKVKELKRELLQAQELLKKIQSRRRELGTIWLKGLEYKEMIKLMDQMCVSQSFCIPNDTLKSTHICDCVARS